MNCTSAISDPRDGGSEMDENQSTALGRYMRLCDTLPFRSLTFDDNLPMCNRVHICRYTDI